MGHLIITEKQSAWYDKHEASFADALAAVRRAC